MVQILLVLLVRGLGLQMATQARHTVQCDCPTVSLVSVPAGKPTAVLSVLDGFSNLS